MILSPSARRFALTAHVACSVGWLGAVASFLLLAIAGLSSDDAQQVRAVYLSLELLGWWLIVPLSFGSLLSGLIQGALTPWGLLRHYWVLIKLLMTPLATAALLAHMRVVEQVAGVARETFMSHADWADMRVQIVIDAAAGALVLIVTTALSVYKPRGVTPHGQRRAATAEPVAPAR